LFAHINQVNSLQLKLLTFVHLLEKCSTKITEKYQHGQLDSATNGNLPQFLYLRKASKKCFILRCGKSRIRQRTCDKQHFLPCTCDTKN